MSQQIDCNSVAIEKCKPYWCRFCRKIPAQPWAAPCGHIYCQDCYAILVLCNVCHTSFDRRNATKVFFDPLTTDNKSGSHFQAKCPICLDELTNARLADCGHTFCEACLRFWIRRNRDESCPICRVRFDKYPTELHVGLIIEQTEDLPGYEAETGEDPEPNQHENFDLFENDEHEWNGLEDISSDFVIVVAMVAIFLYIALGITFSLF